MQNPLTPLGSKPTVCALLALMVLGSILGVLQNPPGLDDGLRHAAMGQLMAADPGITNWSQVMSAGYLAHHAVDPWYLTHQIHKVLSGMSIVEAHKIFSVMTIVLLTVSFGAIIAKLKLSKSAQAVLLILLLLGNVQFTMRLFLARPLFFQVSFCLMALWCVLNRHWVALLPLFAVATLLSQVFVFPLFVVTCGALWQLSRRQYRLAGLTVGSSSLGVALGIWWHPHQMDYLNYIATVFFKIPFYKNIDLAPEMQSGLGRMAGPVVLVGVMVLMFKILKAQKMTDWKQLNEQGLTLMGALSSFFLVTMLAWLRMIDVLWPLGLMTIAYLLHYYPTVLKTMAALITKPKYWSGILAVLILVNTAKVAHYFITTDAQRSLAPFSRSLKDARAGNRVLNIDWGTMPALFAVRPDLKYARGIDPSFNTLTEPLLTPLFTQVKDPQLKPADRRRQISKLLEKYPSDWLVMWSPSAAVVNQFSSHPKLKLSGYHKTITTFIVQ